MIKLHNYNELVSKRRILLADKEKFYKKYFTRDDYVLEEMLTNEDAPKWDDIDKEIIWLTALIERWERGVGKS